MRRAGPVMSIPTVRRASAAVLGVLLAVGGTALTAPAAAAPPAKTAVIVQLTPGSDAAAESRRAAANGGGSVAHVYRNVFQGFAGAFTQSALDGLRKNPRVALIEADGGAAATETAASWGLDRIDQARLPLNGSYNVPAAGGTGVTAYIIDTGVQAHADLDQLGNGFDAFSAAGNGTNDCNGHGTHVAGTVAGTKYGVAKQATVVPVRVLDCEGSGTWSGIIAGLDWAVGNHADDVPAVANMSLGGPASQSVDDAVNGLIADGVTVAVAAGNNSSNACGTSPARVPDAITTGATDRTDKRASFSNYGSCLDLFAPGVSITSAWLGGTTNTISGTSMAAPHVAGAAAVVIAKQSGLTPVQVRNSLVNSATVGVLKATGNGSPNRLLFSAP
jgi:subtilisin family serine protease